MFTFVFLNLLIAWSAFLIVYKALRITGIIDSLLGLFTVYLAQIVVIELILGIANALYLENIIIFTLAVFFVVFIFTKNRRSAFIPLDSDNFVNRLLSSKIYIFVFSVVTAFLIVKILVNLLNPPFGWDSLNYHFTFPVEWLKRGNLDMPPTVFDDPSPSYYPINGSLFYLWLMLPFKSVFMADLGQVPFFIIAVIAAYGIARKIGLNKKLAFYSATIFMLIPNFFKQLQIAYVDIMVAAWLLICVNYLFLLNKNLNLPHLLIYGLSLGLLIGTKTVALPYGILLLIPFAVIYFKNIQKISFTLVLVLCVLVWGGFSYIRNFLDTGNPLYPLDLKILNIPIFRGVIDKVTYNAHSLASDYNLSKFLFHEGLGAQGLLLILPGIFLALLVTVLKRNKRLNFNLIYFFILPFLLYFTFRFIIPLPNLRYLYAFMGIGVILGFYVLDTLRVKKLFINILVVICTSASISELAKRQELIVSIVFSCLLFFFLLNSKAVRVSMNLFKNKHMVVLSLMVLFCLLLMAERYYKKNEYVRYYKMVKYSGFWPDAAKAWDWLNLHTTGNNIAYAGRPVPFPLYGTKFKNNVYYVSVNAIQPLKLHYFPNSRYRWGYDYESEHKTFEEGNNYRGKANYEIWLKNLMDKKTDYLFIYSQHQIKGIGFPLEDKWVSSYPDRFQSVFSNQTIHIYKILK